MIRLYYTKFLKRFQDNHDIVIQIYYNFRQISAAAVSSRFSRRRLIDFLPRLLYNKTVQGAAPAAGKHTATASLYTTLCLFAYRFRSWAAASAAPACSGKQKTRLVQDKPCNLLAGETRGVRSGKAATEQRSLQNDKRKAGRKRWYFFAWTFADRVTRNTRRQPRLRVRTNKKTRLHTKAVFTDWQGRRDYLKSIKFHKKQLKSLKYA